MKNNSDQYPCIIHSNTTSRHDGGVALLLENGTICAVAAERVGNRFKHSGDSRIAYDYLKARFQDTLCCAFGSDTDYFVDISDGLEMSNHHLYHAASAYYASPFDEAAVLIIDGQGSEGGKLASTSIWKGEEDKLTFIETPHLTEGTFAPESIGHFYTAIGAFAGMQELNEEGKTMGLAAYGQPSEYLDYFRRFACSNSDGSYVIDPRFTLAILGNTLGPKFYEWNPQPPEIQEVWTELLKLRNRPIREKGRDVTKEDMNIAYAGQIILEEIVLGLVRRVKRLVGSDYLCLAGGVALNAIVNGKILQERIFKDVFIFPAPGDDGQAIGKLFFHIHSSRLNVDTKAKTGFYGPVYEHNMIQSTILEYGNQLRIVTSKADAVLAEVVDRIIDGKVIGWYQGASELGPRALGHRSILSDPRKPDMREHINLKVKHREWYRPLAPIVLEEEASVYFELDRPSPFMLIITSVNPSKRSMIPAVTHVDGTARVQTVNRSQDNKMYDLIRLFANKTGLPMLLNTSFNKRAAPIVESPKDAIEAFLSMTMDSLVLGDFLIEKTSV